MKILNARVDPKGRQLYLVTTDKGESFVHTGSYDKYNRKRFAPDHVYHNLPSSLSAILKPGWNYRAVDNLVAELEFKILKRFDNINEAAKFYLEDRATGYHYEVNVEYMLEIMDGIQSGTLKADGGWISGVFTFEFSPRGARLNLIPLYAAQLKTDQADEVEKGIRMDEQDMNDALGAKM